jgi:hypothetical protein
MNDFNSGEIHFTGLGDSSGVSKHIEDFEKYGHFEKKLEDWKNKWEGSVLGETV